jgi:hypothetical protein
VKRVSGKGKAVEVVETTRQRNRHQVADAIKAHTARRASEVMMLSSTVAPEPSR